MRHLPVWPPTARRSAGWGAEALGVRGSSTRWALAAALWISLFAAGCRVTEHDVDTWKGTVKGPGKMVAVLLADKFDMGLRTYAALALVEMERHDVNGVTELQNALQRLDPSTREKIMEGLAKGLIALMQKEGGPAANAPLGPPPHQLRAKDAAFTLLPLAPTTSRIALGEAVVRWYVKDFDDRSLAGNYSAEQVVRALGSSAAKTLVDALAAKLPQPALVKLAELIGQLGEPDTKQRAADKLVAIETEMSSEPFLRWLESEIKAQIAGADPARVLKAALLNRDRFIDEGAIPAMKHLADQPVVANRLLAIAASKDPALTDRRTRALQALEGKVTEAQLQPLLALALDPTAPPPVQDYAFDRVGDIRSPKAIPSMWPLVQDGKNQRLRWRAGELVLNLGGNTVLAEFFAKLPGAAETEYEPEELEGYALRMGQMAPLPVAIAAGQLASPDWWDRVIALHYFERKGTEHDVAPMSKLLGDTAVPKGKRWPAGTTVGKVAKQAVDGLRQRLGQTTQPSSG